MSKGLEELKNPIECEVSLTQKYRKYTYTEQQLEVIEKELKALEIIKKYVGVQEFYDDIFPYEIVDKQYASSGSELIISKEEYELMKEVLL